MARRSSRSSASPATRPRAATRSSRSSDDRPQPAPRGDGVERQHRPRRRGAQGRDARHDNGPVDNLPRKFSWLKILGRQHDEIRARASSRPVATGATRLFTAQIGRRSSAPLGPPLGQGPCGVTHGTDRRHVPGRPRRQPGRAAETAARVCARGDRAREQCPYATQSTRDVSGVPNVLCQPEPAGFVVRHYRDDGGG